MLEVKFPDKFSVKISDTELVQSHISKIAELIKTQIKNRTPVKTGYTRNQIVKTKTVFGYEIYFRTDKANRIASYQHYGTRRHWIEPVNRQALSWVEGSKRYFSKGHYVSGIKRTKFFELTDKDRKLIKDTLTKLKIFKRV
jgi:hypothetical protein